MQRAIKVNTCGVLSEITYDTYEKVIPTKTKMVKRGKQPRDEYGQFAKWVAQSTKVAINPQQDVRPLLVLVALPALITIAAIISYVK